MRSPLELDPEFVAAVGLVNLRWAALEELMAETLGGLLKVDHAGPRVYYSLGNFSQRLALLQEGCRSSFSNPKHAALTDKLFAKINQLWKSRNYLMHSHYAYVGSPGPDGSQWVGTQLSFGPRRLPEGKDQVFETYSRAERVWGQQLPEGWAFVKRQAGKEATFTPVNAGTFSNHAAQLLKRARQVNLLQRMLMYEMIPLARTTWTLPDRLPPRSRLSQMGPLVILSK